jgi:hypothetical protein
MQYSIPGTNTLLAGESGSGKTYALRTLLDAGIETFILFTEPGMRTLSDVSCEQGLHWHYIPPAKPDFSDMADSARKINQALDLESLTKQKNWNKTKYQQFIEVVTQMNNFTCNRCGKEYGSVDAWSTDRCLVVDSLSGLNIMAMDLAAGSKPVKSPADWGTAMDNLERFINRLCTGTQCHFVLTAHLEREKDEITGGVQLMASTLGQKLAPKIPRYFDDVVQTKREKDQFHWTTAATNVALKARNLPISDKLEPSFVQIIEAWTEAGGIILPTETEAKQTA